MKFTSPIRFDMDAPPLPAPPPPPAPARVVEAAGMNGLADEDAGWSRLSAQGTSANVRDLTPMSHERMQRLAEFLWQSNLLANRLIEIPLAYLLAEGVKLTCSNAKHQELLDQFWTDPINDFPSKLYPRARDLSLMGEQIYRVFENEVSGFVRCGYVDPRLVSEVVLDPDNPEQPIGVITKKDGRGRYKKYRVIVLGPDDELFSRRTAEIRAGFTDGDVFLFQVNKLATGSRGRSDMLGQIDWIDAYDEFLFGELDRSRFLRAFVWDLELTHGTDEQVKAKAATFRPPEPNSVYVHNAGEKLEAKQPELQGADMSAAARLFRTHVLGGSTVPEHWFSAGGDVNRATAGEMGEPAFKVMTARQTQLKQMLELLGRYVLARQPNAKPDWAKPDWKVTAVFPELVAKDITKFASALREVAATCALLVDRGLLTEERAVTMVADVAQRFGAEFDAKAELEAAREERRARKAEQGDDADAFTTPGMSQPGGRRAQAGGQPAPAGAGAGADEP
jgi:hypothetical protein